MFDIRGAYDDLSRRHDRQSRAEAGSAELAKVTEDVRTLQASLRESKAKLCEAENRVVMYHKERTTVARELTEFETDLKSQRAESKRFGMELQLLKKDQQASEMRHATEMAKIDGNCQAANNRLKVTLRELQGVRTEYEKLRAWRDGHGNCDM